MGTWRPSVSRRFAVAYDARGILGQQVDAAARAGFEVEAGFEIEMALADGLAAGIETASDSPLSAWS